jgi:glycosyltransferase involved in cell wall biosynthesis
MGRMSFAPGWSIVAFWFYDDWGQFGRMYENVVLELARRSEVARVVLLFPPRAAAPGESGGWEVRRVGEKLTLLTELEAPSRSHDAGGSRLAGWLGRWRSRTALRRLLRREGFRRQSTIAWFFPPHPYIDHLREAVPVRFTVSQMVDDFTQFDPEHFVHRFALDQYPEIPRWSDLILTSSEANFEKWSGTGVPCMRLDPGVSAPFLAAPGPLPHRVHGGPPRLGYVGFIMERTDLDLLVDLAGRHPDWRIVLVGPEYPWGILARSGLLAFANVEYGGLLAHERVPAFLQTVDVCLIPHRDDGFSRSMSPLKLLQYLASGRPVVSTAVAGLEHAADHISIARDREEFERMVADALESDTPSRSAKRIEAARAQTWDLSTREPFDRILGSPARSFGIFSAHWRGR